MGVYAVPSNKPFVVKKKINTKRRRDPEVVARRNYIDSHNISVSTDPDTGKVVATVTKKSNAD